MEQENKQIEEKPADKKIIKIDEAVIEKKAEKEEADIKKEFDEIKKARDEADLERTRNRLDSWVPKTKIGKLVKDGKIKNIDEILDKGIKIMESEISDSLLQLKSEFLNIGQSKGKFGGGKRRLWKQTQKKTKEGNVPTFACLAIVGDGNGHIGLGYGKAKETLPAREKAIRDAKINVIRIERGCTSFDCSCNKLHTIIGKAEGKSGSLRLQIFPAPQGTGLVVGDEMKKIFRLAGIKDVYGKAFGDTRTTTNLAKACVDALIKSSRMKK